MTSHKRLYLMFLLIKITKKFSQIDNNLGVSNLEVIGIFTY